MKRASTKKSHRVSSAKIIGIVAAMIVVVATVMAFALPGASAATVSVSTMPSVLPGRGEYTTTTVLDFEDQTVGSLAFSQTTNIQAVGISGDYGSSGNNALYCTYKPGVCADQPNAMSPKSTVNWSSDYDGFMYWFDTTTVSGDSDGMFIATLNLKVGGTAFTPLWKAGVNNAYYCLAGAEKWVPTTSGNITSGGAESRFALPAGKSGWLYIPAESMWAGETCLNTVTSGKVDSVYFYCKQLLGNAGKDASTITYDNLVMVNHGGTAFPATVPTTGIDALSAYSADLIETFGATSKATITDTQKGKAEASTNSATLSASKSGAFTLTYGNNSGGQGFFNYTKTKGLAGGDSVLKFEKGSDGYMFYVDASNAPVVNGQTQISVGLRFMNVYYGNDYRPLRGAGVASGFSNANGIDNAGMNHVAGDNVGTPAYYYDAATQTWTLTTNISTDRIGLPSRFKGYVYVPFSSVKSASGYLFSDLLENYNVYVDEVFVLTGNVTKSTSTVSIDNIMGVKHHGSNYVESAAPTVLPTGQTVTATNTLLDFDSKSLSKWNGSNVQRAFFTYQNADSTGNKAAAYNNVMTNNPEGSWTVANSFNLNGATGMMYYVNTTELGGMVAGYYDEYTGMADGIAENEWLMLGFRLWASVADADGKGTAANRIESCRYGYFYADGQWYKTNALNGNRLAIPAGFEGYIYVPIEAMDLYNGSNYLTSVTDAIAAGKTITATGYQFLTHSVIPNVDFGARNDIYVDNVCLVTGVSGAATSNANSIPDMPDYIIGGTTGLSRFDTIDFVNFEGEQGFIKEYNNGSYNADANKQPGEWKGADMYLKTGGNDTELVINLSTDSGQGAAGFKTAVPMDAALAEDGIMFHLDVSGMLPTNGIKTHTYDGKTYTLDQSVGFALILMTSAGDYSTGNWKANPEVNHVDVFYSYDGSEEWSVTTNYSNSRVAFPADFSGWVYLPYTSLIKGNGGSLTSLADLDTTGVTLNGIRFFSANNNPNPSEAAEFTVDDFRAVSLTTAKATGVAADAEAISKGMYMEDGANIRIGVDNAGIRFLTYISKNDAYNKYFENGYDGYSSIVFGTILIPTDVLGAGELALTNANVLNIQAKNAEITSSNEYARYTAVLDDIPWLAYDTEITAISYVATATSYNIDGTAKTFGAVYYTGVNGAANAPVARSYMGVIEGVIAEMEEALVLGEEIDLETYAMLCDAKNTPTTLPGGAAFSGAQMITDFTDNYKSHQHNMSNGNNKGYGSLVGTDAGAASGLGFKITSYSKEQAGNGFAQATASPEISALYLNNYVSVSGYSGLLFYVDVSGLTPAASGDYAGKVAVAVPIVLRNSEGGTSGWMRSYATGLTGASRAGTGHYYINGAWEKTQPNGDAADRMLLPGGFAGWVYIPFSSYCTTTSTDTSVSFDAKVAEGYNMINSLVLFTGNCGTYGSIVFDSFYLVK